MRARAWSPDTSLRSWPAHGLISTLALAPAATGKGPGSHPCQPCVNGSVMGNARERKCWYWLFSISKQESKDSGEAERARGLQRTQGQELCAG